jgi:cysteine desulfurase
VKDHIYLDANASTFVDPQVLSAMVENIETCLGNPSSTHSFGRKSRGVLDAARRNVADYLKVHSDEIVFSSGGTEGLNLCLKGLIGHQYTGHIISSNTEHPAVHSTLKYLERMGCELTFLDVGPYGAVTPELLNEHIRPNTRLISLMAANNETGVKTDIEAIAQIAEKKDISFVVDAVAWLGKEDVFIPKGVSAMCFSGHKIHAPRGIGACFIRRGIELTPILTGGAHEYKKRSGTENLVGIVAFSKAIDILRKQLPVASKNIQSMRDYFEEELSNRIPDIIINGEGPRISNTSNVSFPGIEGETLLIHLDQKGIAASHGSACSSGALEPSRVLKSMGLPQNQARSALRFSMSRMNTMEEIKQAVDIIYTAVCEIRSLLGVSAQVY